MLQKVSQDEEKVLILGEISHRERDLAEPLIAAYVQQLPDKDPFVRPDAEVLLARVQTDGDSVKYVEALGLMLTSKETAVIDRAAYELSQLGTPDARLVLLEHEATGRGTIRAARLALDYGHLPSSEFVDAMCKSALATIISAGPNAVDVHPVELSLLRERAFDDKVSTYIMDKLDGAFKDELPPVTRVSYVSFLADALSMSVKAEVVFVDKGTSRKAWSEQQVKKALAEESETQTPMNTVPSKPFLYPGNRQIVARAMHAAASGLSIDECEAVLRDPAAAESISMEFRAEVAMRLLIARGYDPAVPAIIVLVKECPWIRVAVDGSYGGDCYAPLFVSVLGATYNYEFASETANILAEVHDAEQPSPEQLERLDKLATALETWWERNREKSPDVWAHDRVVQALVSMQEGQGAPSGDLSNAIFFLTYSADILEPDTHQRFMEWWRTTGHAASRSEWLRQAVDRRIDDLTKSESANNWKEVYIQWEPLLLMLNLEQLEEAVGTAEARYLANPVEPVPDNKAQRKMKAAIADWWTQHRGTWDFVPVPPLQW